MLNLNSIMIGSMQPKVLAEFYEKVFGKPADWAEDIWYGWQVGSTYFNVGEHSGVKGKAKEPQRGILNFEAQEVIQEPYERQGSWIATFADPDGNYFQLMSPWEMEKQ